jgi:hypothetical protein
LNASINIGGPSHPSPPSNHFILNNQLLAAKFKSPC